MKNNPQNGDYPVLFNNKIDCCGCYACYSVCPKNAISFNIDNEGFYYPKIDKSKCIKCYACDRVCPIKAVDKNGKEVI